MPPDLPAKERLKQRIKALMKALGEEKVDPFYKKYFGEDARSERLRTAVNTKMGIKADFLVELTENIAKVEGKKVNGNWLLYGEGEMFLPKKGTRDQEGKEIEYKDEYIELLREKIDILSGKSKG